MKMLKEMMRSNIAMAGAVALAMSSAACNRAERAKMGDEARGHEGAPITLTGCLQKDSGLTTGYILTQVNEPTQSVGTSGSAPAGSGSSSSSVVQEQQMRQAKHA